MCWRVVAFYFADCCMHSVNRCIVSTAAPSLLAGHADDEEKQTALLEAVRAKGIFIIHSKLGSQKILRFACGGIEQRDEEARRASPCAMCLPVCAVPPAASHVSR